MLRLEDAPADLPTGLLRSQTGISNTRMIFHTPSPHRIGTRFRIINLGSIYDVTQPALKHRLTLLR